MAKKNKMSKSYLQKCCLFIGAVLFLTSIPFWLVEIEQFVYVAYSLSMSGFILICITIVHKIIFGGELV